MSPLRPHRHPGGTIAVSPSPVKGADSYPLTAIPPAPLSTPKAVQITERPPVDLEVIVPALNEERRIGATIRKVAGYLARQPYAAALVVVDNGSVDRTADAVVEAGIGSPVRVHLTNCATRGKGAAIRRGILTSHAAFIGFCDADLAAPIETLDVVWPLLRGGAPIVIGSRRCRGATWQQDRSLIRRIGSSGFNLVSCALVRGVSDTQCGFKFFQGEVARRLFAASETDGFSFDVEILVRAGVDRLPIREVPVVWTDCDGSTLRPIRDGVPALVEAVTVTRKVRARRWVGDGRRVRRI